MRVPIQNADTIQEPHTFYVDPIQPIQYTVFEYIWIRIPRLSSHELNKLKKAYQEISEAI